MNQQPRRRYRRKPLIRNPGNDIHKNMAALKTCGFLVIGFLLCACGAAGQQAGAAAAEKASAPEFRNSSMEAALTETGFNQDAPAEINAGQNQKLVKQAELSLRVGDPVDAETPLAALMSKYAAWASSTGIYENSRRYTLRVPSSSYASFLAELSALGRVIHRSESAEDVTLSYYDLEGRLSTKKELLKTFQGYLGKAKDIDEIMTVERRIAELQQEIEWTGTELRNLSYLVDFSTVNLEILGPVTTSSYSKPDLGERLGELFGSFVDVVKEGFIVLVGLIIFGVPVLLVIVLLFWLLFGRIGLLKKLFRLAAGK
jgi:hypothetical protein